MIFRISGVWHVGWEKSAFQRNGREGNPASPWLLHFFLFACFARFPCSRDHPEGLLAVQRPLNRGARLISFHLKRRREINLGTSATVRLIEGVLVIQVSLSVHLYAHAYSVYIDWSFVSVALLFCLLFLICWNNAGIGSIAQNYIYLDLIHISIANSCSKLKLESTVKFK